MAFFLMMTLSKIQGPIGVFDSGYGGLTVLKEIINILPNYDYIYLGDSARTPYGNRSFQVVYEYTLQAVNYLFEQGCHLVILACNTASAKALRNIQQINLPEIDPERRVLGVIRPSVEKIGSLTKTRKVGVLGTKGTVQSQSFPIEIEKLNPDITTYQHACPLWVPIVENNEIFSEGASFFIKKDIDLLLKKDSDIDTIILGCTHYPLLYKVIRQYVPENITIISQNTIVAESLVDYLKRHPEMEQKCSKHSNRIFYTTDDTQTFDVFASQFLEMDIKSSLISL